MLLVNQSSSILETQPLFQYKAHLKMQHCNSAIYSSTFVTVKCCKNVIFSTAIRQYIVQHSSPQNVAKMLYLALRFGNIQFNIHHCKTWQKCYIQHCDSVIYSSTFITAKCCKNAIFSTAIRQYIVQHSLPQNVSKILCLTQETKGEKCLFVGRKA